MKKLLICGLGSIGQRHVRQIKKLTNGTMQLGALRLRNQKIVINDKLEGIKGKTPEEQYKLKLFTEVEAAIEWHPDIVFITNPISMHIDTAIVAAKAGGNIFIEKPLDCSTKRLDELENLVEKKNLTCMIGYQLRYHPGYKKVRELVLEGHLGKITYADLHFGEWLPGMHPYEDYRISHAAKKDQGGGVIFCLSHKIDLAYWIFGFPFSVYAVGGKLSELEMDVEDSVDILFEYKNNNFNFPLHIHLDFIQRKKKCFINVVGEKGSVFFDYCSNNLSAKISNKKDLNISYDDFQRNDMFLMEIKDFLSCCESKRITPIPLNEGSDVLKICLLAHKSLISNKKEIFDGK